MHTYWLAPVTTDSISRGRVKPYDKSGPIDH